MVSAGLEMTGVTAWAGQLLIRDAGEDSRARLLVLMMILVALLTALISVNGAVAALLPVVVVIAVRLKWHSSQLLMPMVFSAHAGSLLALTGTPVNVLVSEAGINAGVGGFGFFEFALVGVPLLAGSMAIMVLFGRHLLPQRNGATMPADFSRHANTLVEQYGLASGIFQLRVRDSSSYVGKARSDIDLSTFPGLELMAVQDKDTGTPLRRAEIEAGDTLLLRGDAEQAADFAVQLHLAFRDEQAAGRGEDALFNARSGLAEVLDLAALEADRTDRVPRHGDGKRRPDHPCRAARGRTDRPPDREGGKGQRRPSGRRQPAAPGHVESAGCPSQRPQRPRRRLARTGASPGGAAGAGGAAGDHHPHRHGGCCSRPVSFRLRSPACSPPAPLSCRGSCASTKPTAPSTGPP